MKKLVAWILMLCVVMGMFCGCDGASSSSKNGKDDEDEKEKVTIEETVVYDDNDIVITVTGLKKTRMGSQIKIKLENNSDYNIALSGFRFVVNGITVAGHLYIEAGEGETVNNFITFFSKELKAAGIENLATVDCIDAYIYDTDSYDNLYDTPFSIETSIAGDYEQEIDDDGDVLFEDSDVTVISKGVTVDVDYCITVTILVKNETGENIDVYCGHMSVDGDSVDIGPSVMVMADTVRFFEIVILNEDLEDNDIDIDDVEEISFYLSFRYQDEWYYFFCETDELTVPVN